MPATMCHPLRCAEGPASRLPAITLSDLYGRVIWRQTWPEPVCPENEYGMHVWCIESRHYWCVQCGGEVPLHEKRALEAFWLFARDRTWNAN